MLSHLQFWCCYPNSVLLYSLQYCTTSSRVWRCSVCSIVQPTQNCNVVPSVVLVLLAQQCTVVLSVVLYHQLNSVVLFCLQYSTTNSKLQCCSICSFGAASPTVYCCTLCSTVPPGQQCGVVLSAVFYNQLNIAVLSHLQFWCCQPNSVLLYSLQYCTTSSTVWCCSVCSILQPAQHCNIVPFVVLVLLPQQFTFVHAVVLYQQISNVVLFYLQYCTTSSTLQCCPICSFGAASRTVYCCTLCSIVPPGQQCGVVLSAVLYNQLNIVMLSYLVSQTYHQFKRPCYPMCGKYPTSPTSVCDLVSATKPFVGFL